MKKEMAWGALDLENEGIDKEVYADV